MLSIGHGEPDAMRRSRFVRDAAAIAAIFGFFGSAWFGWAQENPRSRGGRGCSPAPSCRW
jgi:hypothetical protein